MLLACGVRRIAGREAGVIAAALIATNYVYVMWNRAALMEASMVAFMVAAWYCYVRAQTRPLWGGLAAACALLAYFTKAAAIFFVAALGIEAVLILVRPTTADSQASRKAAIATLAGLVICGIVALALFVMPNWTDYRFYNWQMSVTRKPSYDAQSLMNRVTWFPIVHDIFTRMWFTVVVGVLGLLASLGRWRVVSPAERLLALWIVLGALELLLHDVGNERRFVFFIPALIALTAIVLGRDRRLVPEAVASIPRARALVGAPGRLLWSLCDLRRADPAHGALRAQTWRPFRRCGRTGLHRPDIRDLAEDSEAPGRAPVEPDGGIHRRRAGNGRAVGPVRSVGARTDLQELPRIGRARQSAADPEPSSTASSPTGFPSRTASSPSSWAAGSVTTRTESNATMCGIF